jgi:predicted RNA-binding Zn ribbon-like protein
MELTTNSTVLVYEAFRAEVDPTEQQKDSICDLREVVTELFQARISGSNDIRQ